MTIPGVSGALGHAVSAALFFDAELPAAIEADILQTQHPCASMTSASMRFFTGLLVTYQTGLPLQAPAIQ